MTRNISSQDLTWRLTTLCVALMTQSKQIMTKSLQGWAFHVVAVVIHVNCSFEIASSLCSLLPHVDVLSEIAEGFMGKCRYRLVHDSDSRQAV